MRRLKPFLFTNFLSHYKLYVNVAFLFVLCSRKNLIKICYNIIDFIYGNREFWCRGYYVDTVGKNKKAIAEYIRNQLQEDLAYEQMSIKELVDPFTGEPVKASKK